MRHGLKLLGLAMLAALSLMAFGATAAQATGEFRIGSPLKTFAEAGVASKSFSGTMNKGKFLLEGLKFGCEGGTVSGTAFKGGTVTAVVALSGCTIIGAEKVCKIYSGLGTDKNVGTLQGEGSINLTVEGVLLEHYLLVKGTGGGAFALFDVWGKICSLSTLTAADHFGPTGSTVLLLPDVLTDLVNHEIQTLTLETLKTLFPADKLLFGLNEAHFAEGTGPEGVVTGSLHLTTNENWGTE